MKHWISKGAEPSKLVLGVSTYGRTYTLRNIQNNGYGATSKSPGDAGDYTKQPGMLAFYEASGIIFIALQNMAIIFFNLHVAVNSMHIKCGEN